MNGESNVQKAASGRAPAFAQGAAPKKLVYAHIVPEPESGAVGFAWMAQEIGKRSKGELEVEFHGGTLLSKELEIMNAVKSGNIAIGEQFGPCRRRLRQRQSLSGSGEQVGLIDAAQHE